MLQTCNEVISSNLSDLTTLSIDPLYTLTQVEGVGQTIFGNFPLLSQSGLHDVLSVIHDQAVPTQCTVLTDGCTGGSQAVPNFGLDRVIEGVGVLQSVTFSLQECLCLSQVGAGTSQLSPHQLQSDIVVTSDRLFTNQRSVVTLGRVTPLNRRRGVGSLAVHSVVTASGVDGQHNCSFHQLCFSQCLQSVTLGQGLSLCDLHVGLVELAQDIHVDSLGQFIVVLDASVGADILNGFASNGCVSCYGSGSSLGAGSVLAAASDHGQNHSNDQQHSQNLFHFLSS